MSSSDPLAGATPGCLSGRSVVITRSPEKAESTREALEALGARVTVLPTTFHRPCTEAPEFLKSLKDPGVYSHLVFTSQTAVQFFLEACGSAETTSQCWSRLRVAAVGPATAEALRQAGWRPDLVTEGGAAELARALLVEERGPGQRVLLPQSSIARPELLQTLESAGVPVDTVAVYDTVPEEASRLKDLLAEAFADHDPDSVLFASPSAFSAFLEIAGDRGREALRTKRARIVSIGRTTSAAIRQEGYEVAAEAGSPTVAGVVEATVSALRGRETRKP